MKMTIKEIKEKGEPKDKVKFSAVVKNVYDAKAATPAPGSKSKVISRQNIIVEDSTDTMKVIVSHYSKSTEFTNDIIGKEVNVDGTLTEWEGKMNIFGKLIFKEGEKPISEDSSTIVKPSTASVLPAGIELRKVSLKMAIEFWGSRIGHEKDENGVIETADKFKTYLVGTGKEEKTSGKKKEQKVEEPKEEPKSEKKEEKLSAEKVTLINEIMSLKESHNLNADTFAHYCSNKSIKEMSIEELEKAKTDIGNLTEDIPF